MVTQVRRETPAYAAGLNVDDEILAIDDFRVRADQLNARLDQHIPGDTVALLVARRDQLMRLELEFGVEPARDWRLEADPNAGRPTAASAVAATADMTFVRPAHRPRPQREFRRRQSAVPVAPAVDQLRAPCDARGHAASCRAARSRNDIDMTMYRMRQREFIRALGGTLELRAALIDARRSASARRSSPRTHTQPAQPTTIAHYLLAVIEQLERDAVRLRAARDTTNRNPLGACAITGTGFRDRPRTDERAARLRRADRQHLRQHRHGRLPARERVGDGVLLVGLGRVVQDLLLWCTMEFGYLRLGDGFVQSSSIMPQKRNPGGAGARARDRQQGVGQAQRIDAAVHNTPFGDIVDTEDDLQPLVASMFRDATRAVALVAAAMRAREFDVARLRRARAEGGTTLTELADTLVRDARPAVPHRARIAGRLLKARCEDPDAPLSRALAKASTRRHSAQHRLHDEQLAEILSPRTSSRCAQTSAVRRRAKRRARCGQSRARWPRESWRCRGAGDSRPRASPRRTAARRL